MDRVSEKVDAAKALADKKKSAIESITALVAVAAGRRMLDAHTVDAPPESGRRMLDAHTVDAPPESGRRMLDAHTVDAPPESGRRMLDAHTVDSPPESGRRMLDAHTVDAPPESGRRILDNHAPGTEEKSDSRGNWLSVNRLPVLFLLLLHIPTTASVNPVRPGGIVPKYNVTAEACTNILNFITIIASSTSLEPGGIVQN
eukprot:gene7222-329_t